MSQARRARVRPLDVSEGLCIQNLIGPVDAAQGRSEPTTLAQMCSHLGPDAFHWLSDSWHPLSISAACRALAFGFDSRTVKIAVTAGSASGNEATYLAARRSRILRDSETLMPPNPTSIAARPIPRLAYLFLRLCQTVVDMRDHPLLERRRRLKRHLAAGRPGLHYVSMSRETARSSLNTHASLAWRASSRSDPIWAIKPDLRGAGSRLRTGRIRQLRG